MTSEFQRPRRIPLTPEEVAQVIALRKKRQQAILRKLKRSRSYKFQNYFIVGCIFIYLEILLCYFGPCHYQVHQAVNIAPRYGVGYTRAGGAIISTLDVTDTSGKVYRLVVNDFVRLPAKNTGFIVGKDFLLQKELKAGFMNSENSYRLFAASPVLLLCFLASFISFFGYIMNLNEEAYSLSGLSVLNILALLAVLTI
jgi:hypothetical protein